MMASGVNAEDTRDSAMHHGRAVRGPLARSTATRLPGNRRLPLAYRLLDDAPAGSLAQGQFARDARLALVEAALLIADEPLTPRRLVSIAALSDAAEARRLVRRLQSLYERDGSAFQVEEAAGGYQLLTRAEFHPWLARLRRATNEVRLSAPARETLAIIAYRQPIMRADIEGIRGVQVTEVLRQLMEKGLVRIAGRHNSLGRPVLYGTTRRFLQVFGLKSLKDLPQADQLRMPGNMAQEKDTQKGE
jgi:segregation and condensation protein B